MSGGAYDYKYGVLMDYYANRMYDTELNGMVRDLSDVLYELEWWRSGDTDEKRYRDAVREFKRKWMHQSDADVLAKYEDELQRKCDQLKEELRST